MRKAKKLNAIQPTVRLKADTTYDTVRLKPDEIAFADAVVALEHRCRVPLATV